MIFKSRFINLAALTLLALSGTGYATTTIIFSSASGRLSGFGNAADPAIATNGLRWGLVIDTLGDGFDSSFANTTYDSFTNSTSGFISATTSGVSSISDDYFFTPASLPSTADAAAGTAGSGETGTQTASITSAVGAPNGTDGLIANVTTSDKFAIIWFAETPAEGTAYGLYHNPTAFLLPASGTSVNLSSNFAGNDSVKAANLNFTAVPEPSRLMLLGFGLIGVFFRRRR
jgi:hypothetical protein